MNENTNNFYDTVSHLEETEITAYVMEEKLCPDNVLLGPLGNLVSATVIGIDLNGDLYCASNEDSPEEIIPLLKEAMRMLRDHSRFNRMEDE